jgi:hypothetical protein
MRRAASKRAALELQDARQLPGILRFMRLTELPYGYYCCYQVADTWRGLQCAQLRLDI